MRATISIGEIDTTDEPLHDAVGSRVSVGYRGKGRLIFVDPEPLANWAHECTWIVIGDDGWAYTTRRNWPPEGVQLRQIDPPPAPENPAIACWRCGQPSRNGLCLACQGRTA